MHFGISTTFSNKQCAFFKEKSVAFCNKLLPRFVIRSLFLKDLFFLLLKLDNLCVDSHSFHIISILAILIDDVIVWSTFGTEIQALITQDWVALFQAYLICDTLGVILTRCHWNVNHAHWWCHTFFYFYFHWLIWF